MEPNPSPLPKSNMPLVLTGVIFVLLIVFFFLFLRAPASFPKEAMFKIEEGSDLGKVSHDLREENIIKSESFFKLFVVLFGNEKKISPGYYFFEEKIPLYAVAWRIAQTERHLSPIKITIPEGFTSAQMAEVFAEKLPDFDKANFLLEAEKKEGYLFPDTYFFFPGNLSKDVILTMSQ